MEIINDLVHNYERVKENLQKGQPIILPTDTNYCIGCLPGEQQAVDAIYRMKKRPEKKPLTLVIAEPDDWRKHGAVSNEKLMELLTSSFWPGAFNIVMDRTNDELDYMVRGGDTISITCIRNPALQQLLFYLETEIAITSANISGTLEDKIVTAEIAKEHLADVRFLIKSQVPMTASRSSTMVRILKQGVKVLREGDITVKKMKEILIPEGYHVI